MIESEIAKAIATCGIWLGLGLYGLSKDSDAIWIVAICAAIATSIMWTN